MYCAISADISYYITSRSYPSTFAPPPPLYLPDANSSRLPPPPHITLITIFTPKHQSYGEQRPIKNVRNTVITSCNSHIPIAPWASTRSLVPSSLRPWTRPLSFTGSSNCCYGCQCQLKQRECHLLFHISNSATYITPSYDSCSSSVNFPAEQHSIERVATHSQRG